MLNSWDTSILLLPSLCLKWLFHSCRYFRRLQKRYTPDSRIKADLAQEKGRKSEDTHTSPEDSPRCSSDTTLELPITCINLLRCNMQVSAVPHVTYAHHPCMTPASPLYRPCITPAPLLHHPYFYLPVIAEMDEASLKHFALFQLGKRVTLGPSHSLRLKWVEAVASAVPSPLSSYDAYWHSTSYSLNPFQPEGMGGAKRNPLPLTTPFCTHHPVQFWAGHMTPTTLYSTHLFVAIRVVLIITAYTVSHDYHMDLCKYHLLSVYRTVRLFCCSTPIMYKDS